MIGFCWNDDLSHQWLNAYLRNFSLTNSRSQKLIPKADLKWECPYFYSKFFLEHFGKYLENSKNEFPIVFSKSDGALAGVNCGDRLLVLQSFWSIIYRILIDNFKIRIFGLWSFIRHPYYSEIWNLDPNFFL